MADNLTHEELSKMKVADLKKLLKSKGLSMTGTKSDLVERLKAEMSSIDLATEESAVLDEVELQGEVEEESTDPVPPKEVKTENIDKPTTQETKSEPTSPTLITAPTSDNDILKKRAERFGVVNEDTKKQQRAERFGVVSEDLKKQQRAERFGISNVSSPSPGSKLSTTTNAEDVEKLKERAKRFGQVLSSSLSKVDEDERIKKRKERFGDVTSATNNKPAKFAKITFSSNSQDEEMKKKRAERFGAST